MKAKQQVTGAKRTVERHGRNAQGEVVRLSYEEQVTANDIYTTGVKGDRRVFHRGARIK